MTDRRTEVTMQVADEHGQTTREYVGLLFSIDKSRWVPFGSRYIRALVPRPDSAGATAPGAPGVNGGVTSGIVTPPNGVATSSVGSSQYAPPGSPTGPPARPDTISGLPPGEYFAVAVDDLDGELMRDPETLERLARGAKRVTLADDAKIDVSLRRMKLADLLAER